MILHLSSSSLPPSPLITYAMPLQGHCLCQNVKIEVDDAALPLSFAACYCNNCSTTAGSPFSMVSIVDEDKVKVHGSPKTCE
jgi:hypothetical protein